MVSKHLLLNIVVEFRAFNVISNIVLLEMKKNKSFSIRVPIACEIEYKVIN